MARTPSTSDTMAPGPGMNVASPPWRYNASAWSQRLTIAALAMVGFGISAYLAAYQWRWIDSVWDPVWGGQSAQVLDSDVSHRMQYWLGIPDAALGALAYLGDALFGLAGSTRRWQYRPWLVVVFGIDVIPLGLVGAILVFLQATVVGFWCFLCIVSAIISLILVWLAYDEVWSSLAYLWRTWRSTRSGRAVWRVFWGEAGADAIVPRSHSWIGVWPRLMEIAVGSWLLVSPAILPPTEFPPTIVSESILGAIIIVLAAASIPRRWERLHWLLAPFVLWVILVPYFTVPRPGPALAQSDITAGLVLLMMLILPTRALEPPVTRAAR